MLFYIISGLIGLAVASASALLFANSMDWATVRFKFNRIISNKIIPEAREFVPAVMLPLAAVLFIPGEKGQVIATGSVLGGLFFVSTAAFGAAGAAAYYYAGLSKKQPEFREGARRLQEDLVFLASCLAASVVFSFFPITVKKASAFMFLAAYILYAYWYRSKGRFRDEDGDQDVPWNKLYFSKKKFPEGRLVLLQAGVSVLGMAAGAKFFVSGVEGSLGGFGPAPFMAALLLSPLATETLLLYGAYGKMRTGREHTALSSLAKSLVFKGGAVLFAGITFTDWILDARARLACAASIASALTIAVVFRSNKKAAPSALLLCGAFYAIFVALALLAVK
jgi:cation:H+ antiporter